jgi:hypothetical protein
LTLDTDRFQASRPIVLRDDLSEARFSLECDNPATHVVRVTVSGLAAGEYTVGDGSKQVATLSIKNATESYVDVPVEAGTRPSPIVLAKQSR